MATFGNTSTSGASTNSSANQMFLSPVMVPFSIGSWGVSKLTMRVLGGNTSPHNVKGVITDSSLNILPNGITNSYSTNTQVGLQIDLPFAVPPTITAGTNYYLGFISDSSFLGIYHDALGVASKLDSTNSYASPTNPTDAGVLAGRTFEIYGTFDPLVPETKDATSITAQSKNGTSPVQETKNSTSITTQSKSNTNLWNIATAVFSKSYDTTAHNSGMESFYFKDDGLKLYLVGDNGASAKTVSQYTLSTAWDITTATYVAQTNYSSGNNVSALYLSSDGTKLYLLSGTGSTVREYAFSVAWDITTASTLTTTLSVTGAGTIPEGIAFSADGSTMYISTPFDDKTYQYALSTPWSISSATYANKSLNVFPQTGLPDGVFIKSDGLKYYVISSGVSVIYEYVLSVAWDISTAVYSQSFAISSSDINTFCLWINPIGDTLFIGSANDSKIRQYSMANFLNPQSKNTPTLTTQIRNII